MATKNPIIRNVFLAIALGIIIWVSGYSIRHFMDSPAPTVELLSSKKQNIELLFNSGIGFMQRKQYQQAVNQWQKLLALTSTMPEAYVNLGYALFELADYPAAKNNFQHALTLEPYQANAYYGLAICYEKSGNIAAASGAMRSFIHLSKKDDAFVRKAQAALWEWQTTQQKDKSN